MIDRGYDRPFALGVVGAAGTLGILIPPSLAMILYGLIAEESVADGWQPAALSGGDAPARGIIHFGQSLGIPLAEIGEALAALPADRPPTAADWRTLSEAWAARLDRRIAGLTRLRDALTDCIGCGCLSTEKCPLRNPGDRLAARGKGPRRLVGDT